jgi:hypothetical protein
MKSASHLPPASPALVTQKAVARLPRIALLLFCAAYVLPGLFGRDPWKNEDIAAFGHMWSLALGQASWLHPHVGGIAPNSGGILPYWLGGSVIALLSPWVDPALAARLPFAILLSGILSLTWYATYELACTDAAQPLPLAFGGEARRRDYARAVADGALLALIASLGLLQLGHETTPELLQLSGSTLLLYGLSAAAGKHPHLARTATLASLPTMSASGSPAVAMVLGMAAVLVCLRSQHDDMPKHVAWVLASTALAAAIATGLSTIGLPGWGWRIGHEWHVGTIAQLLIWFTWPTLPLAALTCWHWRHHLRRRHIAVPLLTAVVGLVSAVFMGGSDRALLTALPSLAVLAAFCLPILQRNLGAAIDWFSVCFFTVCAATIWLGYVAVQTGVPASTAANVLKLVPGALMTYSWFALGVALIGTILWLWLVRWRTAHRSHALWRSLVLPAGGVALCWLLLMTLWLPLLDQARSYRLLINRVAPHVPQDELVCAPGASVGLLTALEYFGGYRVQGSAPDTSPASMRCGTLVMRIPPKSRAPRIPDWHTVAQYNQRTRNSELVVVYRRNAADLH